MKIKFLIVQVVLLIACTGNKSTDVSDSIKNSNSLSAPMTNTIIMEEDFDTFFKKFEGDSTFQYSRIEFPLKLTRTDEKGKEITTFISKSEWKFTSLSHPKGVKSHIEKHQINPIEVNIEYTVEDTGVLVDHIFRKRSDGWRLVLILDHSD